VNESAESSPTAAKGKDNGGSDGWECLANYPDVWANFPVTQSAFDTYI